MNELQLNYSRITVNFTIKIMVKLQTALRANYIMIQSNYDYVTLRNGNFLFTRTICHYMVRI